MHGFNNGHPVLKDLCAENDFIFLQEHWLMSSHLSKFNNIHDNFLFYGVSAMDSACSKGILRGRPFGGLGVLVRKSLANYNSFCGSHQQNRAIAVKFNNGDLQVVCIGVYFPSDRSCQDYTNSICSINGFIESSY